MSLHRIPARLATLILVGLVRIYQYGISPMTPAHCRFAPTCSSYAVEAIVCHGPLKGCWLAARRLLRCHPWGGSGFDPVPGEPKARTSHGTSLDHARHGK